VHLVQPVLDRHCVGCHDGSPRLKNKLTLIGTPRGEFSVSYESLKPFVRWYEWGGESIAQAVTVPGHGGANESPLTRILVDANHAESVKMPAEDRLRITIWLDGNAPFYGAYSEPERVAQRRGESILPPARQ